MNLSRRSVKVLTIIFFVALTVRILFLLSFRQTPFYEHPILDARYYDNVAQEVAKGRIIQDEAFFMGPLYPYSLGVFYFLFGHNPLVPRIIQILLGAASCILLYLIGRNVFDESTGFIAAIFYALYEPALFYEQTLLSETPTAFFTLLFILALTKTIESKSLKRWFVTGMLLGILTLFRGNVLLFLPVILLWMFVRYIKDGEHILKPWIIRAGILILGAVMLIFPATLHNYVAEKDFVLVTSNAGINMFIGFNELTPGLFKIPSRVDMQEDPSGRRVAEADTGRKMKSSEISKYWSGRAGEYIRKHPWKTIYLGGLKIYYFWGLTDIPQIYSMEHITSLMPVMKWPFLTSALISPLALAGLFLVLIRKKDSGKTLLVLYILIYMLSLLPFFITARYKIPVSPLLCLFAAATLLFIFRSLREKQLLTAAITLVSVIVLFFLLNMEKVIPRKLSKAHFHNMIGLIYSSEENYDKAVEHYRKSIIAHPTSYGYGNLGSYYYIKTGEYQKAINYLESALEMEPENAKIHLILANSYLAARKPGKARQHYETALKLDRFVDSSAQYNLALLYAQTGEKDKARKMMKEYLEMNPDDEEARKNFLRFIPDI